MAYLNSTVTDRYSVKQLAGILLVLLFATGCYYDKGDQVYPRTSGTPSNCDTTAVIRYSSDVVSILSLNCYGCHGGTAMGGAGYKLDTYSGVQSMANSGLLVRAITHTGPAYTHMPQGGNKLPECDIAKIRTWVRSGALNN